MTLIARRTVLVGAAAVAFGASTRPAFAAPEEPAPIADSGYKLGFADDFDTLDIGETGHRWAPRLWYQRPVSAEHFSVANSVLSLRLLKASGGWEGCNIATEWASTGGGTFFRGGYFEARMKVPAAWPAFWLFSVNHSRGILPRSDDPSSQCAEIDVYEGDSARPTAFCGTIHSNTSSGGGMRDQINRNNVNDVGIDLTRDWHVFSVLWTQRDVVWYLDGKETIRARAFPSTWQDAFIILGIEPGGLLGGPPPPDNANPADLLVDWVRVWAPAAG